MQNQEYDLICDILAHERVTPLFQAITDCRRQKIIGYEALIRGPSDSALHSPLKLFDAAARYGLMPELELLCRRAAIRQFTTLGLDGKLFLNVTPQTLLEADFPVGETQKLLKQYGLSGDRAVIELTEQYPIHDYATMRTAVTHYRTQGFEIAIDDLGAGYSGLRNWSELRPEYVKIDRHFIQNLHADSAKRQFVRSFLEIAHGLGARVIAEGIETQDELATLMDMGLELGQGYYFQRPTHRPIRSIPVHMWSRSASTQYNCSSLSAPVSSLARDIPPVSPDMMVEDVVNLFENSPDLRSLAVVQHGRPLGLIQRQEIMDLCASRYGRSLYGRKPIHSRLLPRYLMVPGGLPVEQLSHQITGDNNFSGNEDFIILDNDGYYAGIGTIIDLLRTITALQIRNARYANPLTQLPGNVPISEYIDELLESDSPFCVAYIDLDHFKVFNDTYGYALGDDVIVALSQLLSRHMSGKEDFIGHVGGDDFIMVMRCQNWEMRCKKILDEFSRLVPSFYNPEHRQKGGIYANDRNGEPRFFPLISVSIGAVPIQPNTLKNAHEVATIATEVKKLAKQIQGNSLFTNRRRYPEQNQENTLSSAASF